jgi:hypothetical protein
MAGEIRGRQRRTERSENQEGTANGERRTAMAMAKKLPSQRGQETLLRKKAQKQKNTGKQNAQKQKNTGKQNAQESKTHRNAKREETQNAQKRKTQNANEKPRKPTTKKNGHGKQLKAATSSARLCSSRFL